MLICFFSKCKRIILYPLLLIACFNLYAQNYITLASTTSTENSGLLKFIIPIFENKTGISVRVLTRGTGQALELGRRGDVDVVFVHAESLEKEFVFDGYGVKRYPVMYNDFVLVGPQINSANILKNESIVSAFKKIISTKSIFVSRGDNSGTHLREKKFWNEIRVDLKDENNSWYREVGSGMGATLNIASAIDGYTLSDRATWETFKNKSNLTILLEGDSKLFNQYGVILVNPKIHNHIKDTEGQKFINWLVSKDGQKLISSFKPNNSQLFFPNYDVKSHNANSE